MEEDHSSSSSEDDMDDKSNDPDYKPEDTTASSSSGQSSSDEEKDDSDHGEEEDDFGVIGINFGASPGAKQQQGNGRKQEGFPGGSAPQPLVVYLSAGSPMGSRLKNKRQRMSPLEEHFVNSLNDTEWQYWKALPDHEKQLVLCESKTISDSGGSADIIPMRFKVLRSNMDLATKRLVLSKIDHFNHMREGSGEYNKMRGWLNAVTRLPLGIYKELPVKPSDTREQIAKFIKDTRSILDGTVYGHDEVKDQIMRILAQWTANPSSKGHVIGLQGLPGTGKTMIVKKGIAQALSLPFAFVALGGASDGSFLEGHGFTYEGSTYGKIADILMKAGSMNPVIFFDELDKVSTSSRGEEIIGILTHLTDPSQNERFCDRYFSELELDLSKALIIFSYNDESLINPILKDRMITINVPGYTKDERKVIARDYLLPEILAQYGLQKSDVVFSDVVMNSIMDLMPTERCGVRNLKRALESIVSWINMYRFTPDKASGNLVQLPIEITERDVKKYIKVQDEHGGNLSSISHMYL